MEFVETSTFTRQVLELLSDEEYRNLQNKLLKEPECGALIKGGGGIRKVRHALQGQGKKAVAFEPSTTLSKTVTLSTCWSSTQSPKRMI
jgi:hypothetical protein